MNSCVAILILTMKENKQHFQYIILYCFTKGKNTAEMKKSFAQCVEEGAVADRTCQKWLAESHGEDFLLDGAPRSVDHLKLIAIESRQ